MSTIKVDNIRIASEAVSRPVTGVSAAWVNFNGTGTIAIRDSLNVGSITDISVGQYGINFTNSLSNNSYSAVATAENDSTIGHITTWNATDWAVGTRNSTTNELEDEQFVSISIHGELA